MSPTYGEILQYLYARLPMFQRVGATAFKKDLSRTLALAKELGDPQFAYPCIHVAGTNGKGSVSSMLASVLVAAGYRTGLYTSPHLRNFTERIRIDGEEMPQKAVVDFVESNRDLVEQVGPSFFEATVAMAFAHFRDLAVDVAVIETGLGGRLDSTNILRPELCAITNISLDHAAYLGNTRALIAGEKAGIIKSGTPVIIGEKDAETWPIFVEKAASVAAPIMFAGDRVAVASQERDLLRQTFRVEAQGAYGFETVGLDLPGWYQEENIRTALAAILALRDQGWNLPDAAVVEGLAHVRRNSGLRGRMEQLGVRPQILADVGHNEAALRWIFAQLKTVPFARLHFVLGVVRDKDHAAMFPLLPRDAEYYFVRPAVPRGLAVDKLTEMATEAGLLGKSYPSVATGLAAAKAAADPEDLIFVGGSTFVVAEVV
ncbi:MAG: folylpolyglutamate synthase/dihydrofolate synthase family protein [Bacteroidota bacterium]